MKFDYDLIILGSGPAGFSAAMQSTKFNKKVLLVEADEKHLGGAWINAGTVPSKALREAAAIIYKHSQSFGDTEGKKAFQRFKMKDLLRYKSKVVDYENSEVKRNLIKNEVDTARGYGRIIDENTVEIDSHTGKKKRYTSKFILLSTGSRSEPPAKFTVDHKIVKDNTSLTEMTHIPRRLVIIGSGVNAVEYATIFAALGTKVSMLNLQKEILPFLDDEIRDEFFTALKKHRIVISDNVVIESVDLNRLRNCTEVRFKTKDDDRLQVIETEQVIHFGRRMPNTKDIGLENVGITTDSRGYINVDKHYRTSVPSIFAAGDITGQPGLASASFTQGRVASCNMHGESEMELAGFNPYGIYTIPEISSIGLTEKEAEGLGKDITIGRAFFKELTKSSVSNNELGLLKLVIDTSTQKLLGVHIIGEFACDLIHIGQSVLVNDLEVSYFIDNILNYPTFSEAYRVAAFNGINRINKAGVKYRKTTESA